MNILSQLFMMRTSLLKQCSEFKNISLAGLFLLSSFMPSKNEAYDFKPLKNESKINDRMTTKVMSTTCIIIMDRLNYFSQSNLKKDLPLDDLEPLQKEITKYSV